MNHHAPVEDVILAKTQDFETFDMSIVTFQTLESASCKTQQNQHCVYFLTSSLSLLLSAEPSSFPLLTLEDEGIFTTSSSAATTPQSQDTTIQEVNILPNEASPEDEGTANTTDA